MQAWGSGFDPLSPSTKARCTAHTCDPSAGEAEQVDPRSPLASEFSLAGEFQALKDPVSENENRVDAATKEQPPGVTRCLV